LERRVPAPGVLCVAEFETAYRAYRQRVYRWALRFSAGNGAAAEDLVQDAFTKLLQAMPNLKDPDDLAGWLYRVTANLAMYRLRRENRFLKRLARLFSVERGVERPDEVFSLDEQAAAVLGLIRALPPRERVVLSMRYLDGKSGREIARSLRVSEGYVSKLLARAVERVRAQGWEVEDA
jgi:RNA polymerase sigma factor (sigma-70 family)